MSTTFVSRFLQEFVDNPLLIDGHSFDIGVYILITSIDPLRIYRWKSDILIRFCPEPFSQRDPESSIVVQETHKPYWEIPSFGELVNKLNYSALDAFNYILSEQGHDYRKLWDQIDDATVSITLSKSKQIHRYSDLFKKTHFGVKRGFFELLRFDFIVDDEIKVHLVEVRDLLL